MVLYHVVTTYHILKSVLHKLNNHPEEEAILLVPSFIRRIPDGLKNISEESIFHKVIYYDWERKFDNIPNDAFYAIEKTLLHEAGINLHNAEMEINVFRAAYFFGSYLASKNIKFNWFEEADGRYTSSLQLMLDDERIYYDRFFLANELGLYTGDNDAVIKKYVSIKSQIEKVEESDKLVDFDTVKEIKKLDAFSKEKILRFFGVPSERIEIKENSALLLTQHACNMGIMSMEEQILMYMLTIDYFMKDYAVYIKPHPSDLVAYGELFERAKILSGSYPSELIDCILDEKFKMIMAVSSTGINNLESICEEKLLINEAYFETFWDNDLYYFVCSVLKCISEHKVLIYGVNQKQMEAMVKFGGFDMEVNLEFDYSYEGENFENVVIILGKNVSIEVLQKIESRKGKNVTIILMDMQGYQEELNMLKNYAFAMKKLRIMKIEQTECFSLESNKYVYVLSDNEEVIRKVNNMEYEKLLLNTGVKVRVDSNTDKDVQIAVLTGMLEATERTLKKYHEENEKLKSELK